MKKDFLKCIICYEEKKREYFKKAKCGHLACSFCWNITLKEKLECIICKSKVRPKTLKFIE